MDEVRLYGKDDRIRSYKALPYKIYGIWTRLEKSLHMNLKSKTKPISAFSTETFLNKVSKSYFFDGQRKETKEMLLI